jgi:hypothetical protein
VKKQARAKEPEPKHGRKRARKNSTESVPTQTARDESKGRRMRRDAIHAQCAHLSGS